MNPQPHQERLIKIWRLDVDSFVTGGWTPEPVALKITGGIPVEPRLGFRCEVPSLRKLSKSDFEISSHRYALAWHPVVGFHIDSHGDPQGGRDWIHGEQWAEEGTIYSVFRRNCWLSGCLIPTESQHEIMEWLNYGRDLKLSTDYLKRIYSRASQ